MSGPAVVTKLAWQHPLTRWLLLCGSAVCAAGWWLQLRPAATVWGDVASWVAGIATAAGLFFAAIQIRASRQQRTAEEERRLEAELNHREAMARAVGIRSNAYMEGKQWYVDYTLHNGGDYPVNYVMVVFTDLLENEPEPQHQRGTAREIWIGSVFPNETLSFAREDINFTHDPVYGETDNLAAILFTDTWGTHWARTPLRGLMQMPAPPRHC